MAKFTNVKDGLLPSDVAEPARPKIRKPESISEVICEVCGGQVGFKSARARAPVVSPCQYCSLFFGLGPMGGCTNDDPESADAKLAKIRECGWLIVLRRGHFGGSGGEIEVEPGDVFKATRVGDEARRAVAERCSRERTKALFTVSIMLAGTELIQYTHEVAAIPFLTVMTLKQKGELVENFVSTKDDEGHFVPTPDLRREIYNAFGRLVNAP